MRIILATGNQHKVEEMQQLFRESGIGDTLVTSDVVGGMPVVEETADRFAGNALIKAKALAERAEPGDFVLADDSGLEVIALDGRPGVYSSRYAGEQATDSDNCNKLLEEMKDVPAMERTARFVCVLCILEVGNEEAEPRFFEGICPGQITESVKGDQGFGYDPLFMPDGCMDTMAALGSTIKNTLSHRAAAIRLLANWWMSR